MLSKSNDRPLTNSCFASLVTPDEGQIFLFIKGTVFSFSPNRKSEVLFHISGFNVRRRVLSNDEPWIVSRELVFYLDKSTELLLETWHNPFTGGNCKVEPIKNERVNWPLKLDLLTHFMQAEIDGNSLIGLDMARFYTLPGGSPYSAVELFAHFVPSTASSNQAVANSLVSWCRVGPPLPWMQMAGADISLVYHALSTPVRNWAEIPENIRSIAERDYPLFLNAPDSLDPTKQNSSSWTHTRPDKSSV